VIVFRRRRVHLATLEEWTPSMGGIDVYDVLDAPGPLALAARSPARVCGLWLRASSDYPLTLLARDLVTCARLVPLSHVVYEGEEIDRECLEELVNGRPAPVGHPVAGLVLPAGVPREFRVWVQEGATLRHADEVALLV
jgi:hypothetical protein